MARDDPAYVRSDERITFRGKSPKVAIFVRDFITSGPIARANHVARQLQARGADVTLMVQPEICDSQLVDPGIKRIAYDTEKFWRPSRRNPQLQLLRLRPDILLIDEYPFVPQERAGEWERVIEAARLRNPRVKIFGMSCDIPIYDQQEEAPHLAKRAARLDTILVTGDPRIVDFDDYLEPGSDADAVRAKRRYVGFMSEPAAPRQGSEAGGGIVVYLGGHELNKYESRYISLLANIPHMDVALRQAQWHVILPANHHMLAGNRIQAVLGRLPEEIRANIHLEQAGPGAGFTEKLHQADMAITGGGQTAIESALIERLPTVIVPTFITEQFHRAERFAAAMPEHVASLSIPRPEVKKVTQANLINAMHYGDKSDWIDKVQAWAGSDEAAAAMRATIERIYAARQQPVPDTKILTGGAQRIATALLQSADAANARAATAR